MNLLTYLNIIVLLFGFTVFLIVTIGQKLKK